MIIGYFIRSLVCAFDSFKGSAPLPTITVVPAVSWSPLALARVFCVSNPAGEESGYYRRSSAVLHSHGCPQPDASREQWQRAGSGDSILLVVPTSKTDQFGLVHCPFPCVIPYDASPSSAFQSIRDIELTEPCVGSARERRPLFATPEGEPYQGHVLRQRLHQLVTTLFGSSMADVISFHSFRIEAGLQASQGQVPVGSDPADLAEDDSRIAARLQPTRLLRECELDDEGGDGNLLCDSSGQLSRPERC